MSTNTANYNLVKPDGNAGGDFIDVAVLDSNMDKIDAAIKARADAITALTTTVNGLATQLNSLLKSAAGEVTIACVNGVPVTVTVTFPVGRFSVPPAVVANFQDGSPAVNFISAWNITKDDFSLSVHSDTTTNRTCEWIAREIG